MARTSMLSPRPTSNQLPSLSGSVQGDLRRTVETLTAIRGILAYEEEKLQLAPLTFDAWKILVRWMRAVERFPDLD